MLKNIDGFNIYLNQLFIPRTKGVIEVNTPNYIRIDTSKTDKKTIIYSGVFNSGWKAYLNGSFEYPVQQTPIGLMALEMHENTDFIDLKYHPKSFTNGLYISLATIAVVLFKLLVKKSNGRKK